MKKITLPLLLIALTCGAFTLTSCDNNNKTSLEMNKRYIKAVDLAKDESLQNSYLFHEDGTGIMEYHYDFYIDDDSKYNQSSHWAIKFKYNYADKDKNTIACFYDGLVERYENDDGKYMPSEGWNVLINVSKDILTVLSSNGGYSLWVNDDYVDNLSNYIDYLSN